MEQIQPYHVAGNYPEDYLPRRKLHYSLSKNTGFIDAPAFEKFRQEVISTRYRGIHLLNSSYQLPAQYLMIGLLMIYIGRSILSLTGIGNFIIIIGYLLFSLEILGPIISRISFYDNVIANISNLHSKAFNNSRILRKVEKVKYWS
ncbi:MAG: hypothetical protein ACP5NZ_02060 [Nanobdellota archaeon]